MMKVLRALARPVCLLPLLTLWPGCTQPPTDEERGARMLADARTRYAAGQYTAARDTILALRHRFPTALDARRQAILLLDSIELQLADGDTLKEEFYRRKLTFDKEKLTR